MSGLSRRFFLAAGAALPMMKGTSAHSAETRALKGEERAGGLPLMEAIRLRRSTRLYSEAPIDPQTLSDLLWAAYGINRPKSGGRTVPSWHTSYGTDLYVASSDGVWLYDAREERLTQVIPADIRKKTSPQPFVGAAPVVLIYVADLDRMYEAPDEERIRNAHVDAAILAQNVYLFAASAGLGTCLVGGADRPAIAGALSLPDRRIVTFVQPIGHPKAG